MADVLAGVRQKTGAAIDAPAAASNDRVAVNLGPAPADEVLTKLLDGSRFDYIILNAPQQPATVQRVILQEKQGGTAVAANNSPTTAAPQSPPAEDNGDVGMPDTEAQEEVQPEPGPGGTEGAQQASPEQPGTKTPEQLLEELKQMQIQQQQQQQNQQPQQQPQVQPRPQIQMPPQQQQQPPQAGMPPEINSPPPMQPE